MSSTTPTISGGALRLDILDPSIARTARLEDRPADAVSVSLTGTFARKHAAFHAALSSRHQRYGDYGAKIGPRHDHLNFAAKSLIEPVELKAIDLDKVEAMRRPQFFFKWPRPKEVGWEVEGQLENITPQFFLRNIRRMELSRNPMASQFLPEIWRDNEEYGVELGPDKVLTYAPPSLLEDKLSWHRLQELRGERDELLEELDWFEYHGRWRENFASALRLPIPMGLVEDERVKGRFANADELLEELNSRLQRPLRSLPAHVRRYYRLGKG